MAQRTIHYLFGEILSNQIELKDKERFLLGNVMPDAIEPSDRDKSHFKVKTDTHVYFDFAAFRKKYWEQMLIDDLYLGYYMHLVEDAFYRLYIYQDRFTMPKTRKEVPILHRDYHILNSYIVSKYDLHNIIDKDFCLEDEPIYETVNFKIREFLEEMSSDFVEDTRGETRFLTEEMLDEFMEQYVPLAVEEIKQIKKGHSILNTQDYVWLKRK